MIRWIVLHPETGDRLCQDFRWKYVACFGSYPSCVKGYKRQGNAQNAANRFRINGKTHIIGLKNGQCIDAAGRITKDIMNEQEQTFRTIVVNPAHSIYTPTEVPFGVDSRPSL